MTGEHRLRQLEYPVMARLVYDRRNRHSALIARRLDCPNAGLRVLLQQGPPPPPRPPAALPPPSDLPPVVIAPPPLAEPRVPLEPTPHVEPVVNPPQSLPL